MAKKKTDYKLLLKWLCRELKQDVPKNIDFYSDYQLIDLCNKKLVELDCLPFTFEEMEDEV